MRNVVSSYSSNTKIMDNLMNVSRAAVVATLISSLLSSSLLSKSGESVCKLSTAIKKSQCHRKSHMNAGNVFA